MDSTRIGSAKSQKPWGLAFRVGRILLIVYMLICAAFYFLQDSLLFARWSSGSVMTPEEGAKRARAVGVIPWDGTTGIESPPVGYVREDFGAPARRGTIVVFHGNASCAFDRTSFIDAFRPRGFRTFLYEYPGYGGRPGEPGRTSIVPDARALIRKLDQAGLGPIYVWGESLGSGIAAAVCEDQTLTIHGLTLASPWDTLTHAASFHYPFVPIAFLLRDKFDSIASLAHFSHPVCVICGTKDDVLPMRLGQNLYDHLPEPKLLLVREGFGHGDWPSEPDLPWWDEALNFLAPPQATGGH